MEKHRLAGMDEDSARRQARVAFGTVERASDECHDARGVNFLETAIQDVRYGLRAMRNHPGFFGIAGLALALGIGASMAVFSLVNTILLKPLPYPHTDRVVMLW